MSKPATVFIEISFVDLHRLDAALSDLERRRPRLPHSEKERAAKLGERAARWLACRIALRAVLARHCGERTAQTDFLTTAAGKPYLPGREIEFSLAHTDGAALIALSDHPIGVDIENTQRTVRIAAPRRAALIATAAALLPETPLPQHDGSESFIQAWVRLEATAKATGDGLGPLLSRAGVFGPQNGADIKANERHCRCADLVLPEDYRGAVAIAMHGPTLIVPDVTVLAVPFDAP